MSNPHSAPVASEKQRRMFTLAAEKRGVRSFVSVSVQSLSCSLVLHIVFVFQLAVSAATRNA